MGAGSNDAIRLVPTLGEKSFSSAWSDLKDAGEGCLFENNTGGEWGGKVPRQWSFYSMQNCSQTPWVRWMLKQKTQNILLSRDKGQCAAVVCGVRKFTKLPTLPQTIIPPVQAHNTLHYCLGNLVSTSARIGMNHQKNIYTTSSSAWQDRHGRE